jgi:hypothetical protein
MAESTNQPSLGDAPSIGPVLPAQPVTSGTMTTESVISFRPREPASGGGLQFSEIFP